MEKLEIFINYETCSNCGICSEICPAFIFEHDGVNGIKIKQDFIHLCFECGQCMAVCKTKSIFVKSLDYDKDFYEFSDDDNFFSIIEKRRSVRRFKPLPVKKELIEKILDAVSKAPHGDKNQHVEITVINNRNKIIEGLLLMSEFYDKLAKWLHNPIMRKLIQLETGKDKLNTLINHLLPRIEKGIYHNISFEYDGITRGAHTLLIFHAEKDSEEHKEDSMIFVTYATLAAQALNLGSTIVELVPPPINKIPKLKKIFNIPNSHEAIISLIIGYPKYRYQRGIRRNLKRVHWL